jgi:hypothetical protein
MTWGNFQRYALGYVKRIWIVNREIIAAIRKIRGEDVFSFGTTDKESKEPTPEDRDRMRLRHENTIKLMRDGR